MDWHCDAVIFQQICRRIEEEDVLQHAIDDGMFHHCPTWDPS